MKAKPAARIIGLLEKRYGANPWNWHTTLQPFQVLISTILSQRTKDSNTDKAAGQLFAKYRMPEQIAHAPVRILEKLIKPSGFYRVKARRIKEVSRIILEDYGGKVPESIDELVRIPGVGRKTAGCVLVYGYGIADSIPTDTHVHRISNRIGLVKTKTPGKTEQALMKAVPRTYWMKINQLLVVHGQNICRPVGPKCPACPVNKYCDYYKNVYLKMK